MIDLAIIGGGPAALSAGIYASRAGFEVKIFESKDFGGTLPFISRIENYPGFVGAGFELAQAMSEQAKQTGAILEYGECTEVEQTEDGFSLTIDEGKISARAVLVASGSSPKRLTFTPNTPVSYCALCDGALTKGKNVVVVGGANSATQEALYLSNIAKTVTILTHSQLKADSELIERVQKTNQIKVIENTEPTAEMLNQYDHAFIYIGKQPATKFLPAQLLDKYGYIMTGQDKNYPHQSKIKGIFAAGDVRQGSIKQVVTATGDGAMAALEIIDFLQKERKIDN